jgi:hypothetical protein
MNPTKTLLEILSASDSLVTLYSARGLTQTLKPIEAAVNISRSINGNVMDLTYEQFRKYQSDITCTDVEAPAIDGLWPGMFVTVDCTCELAYVTAGGSPSRTVVPGSTPRVEGNFTHYRPRLLMTIVEVDLGHAEYPADYAWKLALVEN